MDARRAAGFAARRLYDAGACRRARAGRGRAANERCHSPTPECVKSQLMKHLLGRNLRPIPDKALAVRTRCSFRDVAGGRELMTLQVTRADVRRFVAQVSIPKQGIFRFDLKNIRQTARRPNLQLTDNASGGVVSLWEQNKGLTVAFNACQARCNADAFSALWPNLIDTRNGRCS